MGEKLSKKNNLSNIIIFPIELTGNVTLYKQAIIHNIRNASERACFSEATENIDDQKMLHNIAFSFCIMFESKWFYVTVNYLWLKHNVVGQMQMIHDYQPLWIDA